MKHIAPYSIFISGICLITFGHYAEEWGIGYLLAFVFAFLYFIGEGWE